jgi:hypothetical protein
VYGPDSVIEGDFYDDNGNLVVDIISQTPSSDYEELSGTSMAAPHVTGALGLLIERFPYLDNAQVRDVLLTTATDLGAAGVDDVYGWGMVTWRGHRRLWLAARGHQRGDEPEGRRPEGVGRRCMGRLDQ